MKYTLVAPCYFGTESVLNYEIKKIGGEEIQVSDGRIVFKGDERVIAAANINLRTAERVLILIKEFKAKTFDELFDGIHAIDWIYAFAGKKFLSVNASCAGTPERTALCRFDLEGGTMASVTLDYYRPEIAPTHDDDRIRCVGTEGILEVRDGMIHLMNRDGVRTIAPDPAPELFTCFLEGNDLLSPDELFYLTRVALLARESADTQATVAIEN